MSEIARAIEILKESGLDEYDQGEFLEMFEEDLQKYSEATALEKLQTSINDMRL